jgi:hypothetical protein
MPYANKAISQLEGIGVGDRREALYQSIMRLMLDKVQNSAHEEYVRPTLSASALELIILSRTMYLMGNRQTGDFDVLL